MTHYIKDYLFNNAIQPAMLLCDPKQLKKLCDLVESDMLKALKAEDEQDWQNAEWLDDMYGDFVVREHQESGLPSRYFIDTFKSESQDDDETEDWITGSIFVETKNKKGVTETPNIGVVYWTRLRWNYYVEMMRNHYQLLKSEF